MSPRSVLEGVALYNTRKCRPYIKYSRHEVMLLKVTLPLKAIKTKGYNNRKVCMKGQRGYGDCADQVMKAMQIWLRRLCRSDHKGHVD